MEVVDEGDVLKVRDDLTDAVHKAAHAKGRYGRANKRQGENGAKISEEIALFHGVTSVKYNRRKENVEKDFRIKCCLFVDFGIHVINFT